MNTTIFEYQQGETTYFSTVLNSKFINENSKVLIYGEDERGYQRSIKDDHVRGIKKYINEHPNYLFPSSIILAMDKKEYENCKRTDLDNSIYKIDLNNMKFRIVDGQHRLKALHETNQDILLNVIVMIISEGKEKLELDVFTNLNSKAKRIPTDLAELAKFKYQILSEGKNLNIDDSADFIAMKTATDLNENNKIWKNAIKVNINSEINTGIVGISAYKKSILSISKKINKNVDAKNIKELEDASNICYSILEEAWDICFDKWSFCFNESDNNKIYNTKYYLQKTMGVSIINGLINEYLDYNNTIDGFKSMIENSNVKISDWETAGIMSGHSSEAGFSKIRKLVKGEIQTL